MSFSRLEENATLLCLIESFPFGKSAELGNRAEELGSAIAVLMGGFCLGSDLYNAPLDLSKPIGTDDIQRAADRILGWKEDGIDFVSVLDSHYPMNLREVYDRPAAVYMRGQLVPQDTRAVAIVGTRKASEEGKRRATRLARALAAQGVTVFSGLAVGIDTAAHTAALSVSQGRTVGVIGTGLRRSYPKENSALQQFIGENFCLISQFDPDFTGAKYSFPMRNKVMSGLCLATVVIEAAETSGAKMQAQSALKHGRTVFLVKTLVEQQPWAQKMMNLPNVHCLKDESQILTELGPLLNQSLSHPLELSFA